ncbi:MAG: hypothetical protein ACYDBH_14100 [Acidobacteriaceae bacterium]
MNARRHIGERAMEVEIVQDGKAGKAPFGRMEVVMISRRTFPDTGKSCGPERVCRAFESPCPASASGRTGKRLRPYGSIEESPHERTHPGR